MVSSRATLPVVLAFVMTVLVCAWPLVVVQDRLDAYRAQQTARESIQYLPSGRFLSTAILGYDNFVADLLWVRGISMFGDRYQRTQDSEWYTWLFQLIDLATELDPLDVRIYKYGGIMLRLGPSGVDQSNYIFHKGMQTIKTEYFLPFGLAMNYLEYKKDSTQAAKYMKIAAETRNAPFYLRNLAASLMDETHQQEAALTFLEEELKELKPNTLHYNAVVVKIMEVKHDSGARELTRGLGRFLSMYNRVPVPLEEMKGKTWHGAWPNDPYSGRYLIDPGTGRIRSSRYEEAYERFRNEFRMGIASKKGLTAGP